MKSFLFVKVSGSTPYECGKQYGEQAKELIATAVADYKLLFAETSDKTWEQITEYALSYLPIIRETMPDILEEAEGIAYGAGVLFGDIMVLNCRYEITKFPKDKECTTGTVLPEASKDGAMYLIKNWDYRVGIIDHIVVLHITEPDGNRIIGITEAGQLVRDGMNTYGIALVNNNLQSIYDTRGVGVPSCFLRRKVLKCKSFDEGKKLICSFKRSVSCNMMMVSGIEKKAADFEVYPMGTDIVEPEQGVLTHANHFLVQPEIHALTQSPRGERLRELLMSKHGQIDVAHIKACLSDHKNYPYALCRHPADVSVRLGRRSITVACEIYDFEAGVVHICAGPPCEGEFKTYVL